MAEDENIVIKVCKKLEIMQKELAQRLEVPSTTILGWANGEI